MVAFNLMRTHHLFFNAEYFSYSSRKARAKAPIQEVVAFWYSTFCHELAHNVVADHGEDHNLCTQELIVMNIMRLHSFDYQALEKKLEETQGKYSQNPPR